MKYPSIRLASNGKKRNARLHILVAEAFIPNPLNLPEVNHKNCIKTDCKAGNLEWSTHAGNMAHAAKNRRHKRKLNTKQVKEMCTLRQNGSTLRELAAQFEIHWTTVHQITSGQTWKSL
jgi:HNH endonuclease